jgi:hypothetical protein
MAVTLPFCGPSYLTQSPIVDAERSVNLYLETMESPTAKTRGVLYPAPGLLLRATMAQSTNRGCFSQDGRCFFVGGPTLYELSDGFLLTELGTVAIDQYPATLCSNGQGGHQLFVTSGNNGYIFDLNSSVFTHVLTGARMGGFLDGYFLALDADSSTLKLSGLEDGTSWDILDVAQRSTGGDKWIAMHVVDRDVWLLGSQSSEVWYNSGASLFPLEPIDGAFFRSGIAAPFSGTIVGGKLCWLGNTDHGTGTWVQANGYDAQRMSTHAVDFAVQGYSTISDAVAFSYQDQGHEFAVMNFPTASGTWAFDTATGLFHERGYWDVVNNVYQAYRPQYHTYAFGLHLVGDRSTGRIYSMDISHATDVDGLGIRRMRQVPVFAGTSEFVSHHRLTLGLETGLGLSTGQGSAPVAMLQWSNDGAKTWGNEHWTSVGALGKYGTQVVWNRLGHARGDKRVYRAVMTDPIPWRINQAELEAA